MIIKIKQKTAAEETAKAAKDAKKADVMSKLAKVGISLDDLREALL